MTDVDIKDRDKIIYHTKNLREISDCLSFCDSNYELINSFMILQNDKNFRFTKNYSHIDLNRILNSAVNTLHSIYYAILLGNVSDAFILLRRYREDLFFYLYLVTYNEDLLNNFVESHYNFNENDSIINKWIRNEQNNLDFFKDIVKFLGNSSKLKEMIDRFGISKKFSLDYNSKINNYVHWNGLNYYNENQFKLDIKLLGEQLHLFKDTIDYIQIVFFSCMALVYPLSILSTDYFDLIENCTEPKGEFEYSVAPFLSDYFRNKSILIDDNFYEYLLIKTGMLF